MARFYDFKLLKADSISSWYIIKNNLMIFKLWWIFKKINIFRKNRLVILSFKRDIRGFIELPLSMRNENPDLLKFEKHIFHELVKTVAFNILNTSVFSGLIKWSQNFVLEFFFLIHEGNLPCSALQDS